mgnify:CR=1 FL=1
MKMYVSREDSARTDSKQRDIALSISEKLRANSPLSEDERGFAAEVLRAWSERPQKKLDGRNRPSFCHGSACREYAWLIANRELKPTDALNLLADQLGVSAPAIRKAVEANKEEVQSLIETYSRK